MEYMEAKMQARYDAWEDEATPWTREQLELGAKVCREWADHISTHIYPGHMDVVMFKLIAEKLDAERDARFPVEAKSDG